MEIRKFKNQIKLRLFQVKDKDKILQKKSNDELFETSVKQHMMHVKLSKYSLMKFYGNINNWLSFWNSFESVIDKK